MTSVPSGALSPRQLAAMEMEELGVGINISPHGPRELVALGLLPELNRLAIRTN